MVFPMRSFLQKIFGGAKKPSIEIFVRHCHYSSVSAHKKRFASFSREKCFHQLLETVKDESIHLTFFLDTFHPIEKTHFLYENNPFSIVEMKAGTEAGSFLFMLNYVLEKKLAPDTIIYFLEDDYLHRPGWVKVLQEAFTLQGVDYATLYDHRDKYFLPQYETLHSKIYYTPSCHWRTTPSTTNTYAMRFKTLQRDISIHRHFSLGCTVTQDHDKFCRLREKGAVLVSSIPGFATHAEPEFASPCFDWEALFTGHEIKSQ